LNPMFPREDYWLGFSVTVQSGWDGELRGRVSYAVTGIHRYGRVCPVRRTRVTLPLNGGNESEDDNGEVDKQSKASEDGRLLAKLPLVPFQDLWTYPDRYEGRVGAFAIFDARRTLRYLGYSRNVRQKLGLHARLQAGACQYFKVFLPWDQEKVTPDELERVLEVWVQQNGRIPTGNTSERHLWEVDGRGGRAGPVRDPFARRGAEEGRVGNGTRDALVSTRSARRKSRDPDVQYRTAQRIPRKDRGYTQDPYDEMGRDEFEYDPYVPRRARRGRDRIWPDLDDDLEEWVPIAAIFAVTALLWLAGTLSTASSVGTGTIGF